MSAEQLSQPHFKTTLIRGKIPMHFKWSAAVRVFIIDFPIQNPSSVIHIPAKTCYISVKKQSNTNIKAKCQRRALARWHVNPTDRYWERSIHQLKRSDSWSVWVTRITRVTRMNPRDGDSPRRDFETFARLVMGFRSCVAWIAPPPPPSPR